MDNYKVLLVDDEPLSTEGLKLMIDWKKLGYSICGECKNGEEALEKIKELRPQLVITDIKMPGMDGLQLISESKRQMDYNLKFIIMSGFGEFEYAKRAMQEGVSHYILKPLINDEISEILSEVYKEIEKEEELYKLQEKSDNRQIEELVYCALGGTLEDEDSKILKKFEHDKLKDSRWYYIILDTNSSINGEAKLKSDMLERVVTKYLNNLNAWVMLPYEGTFGIVAGAFDNWESITEYVENLIKSIEEQTKVRVYAAVGDGVKSIMNIKHSFCTATKAQSYSFFEGNKGVFFYDDIKEKNFSYAFEKIKYMDDIIEATENLDKVALENSINLAFEHFRKVFLAPEIIKMLALHVINKIVNMTKNIGGSHDELVGIYQNVSRKDKKITVKRVEELVTHCCNEYISQFKTLRGKSSNPVMDKVESFIQQNYKRSVTLKEMAGELYMHPAYLGQIFYKSYGMSFNEYLHKLRIEEAKRLLAIPLTKSHEVATELGYCNYNSFLQYFEKYEGIKPIDYKNSIKNS